MYMCVYLFVYVVAWALGGQERASDSLELELPSLWNDWRGCWEINSSSACEQCVLLTTGPSLKLLLLFARLALKSQFPVSQVLADLTIDMFLHTHLVLNVSVKDQAFFIVKTIQ